jgi:hypothetical protein
MRRSPRRCATALAATAICLATAQAAAAHVTKQVGPLRVTYGWGEEPAFTATPNFVQVAIVDRAGLPVVEPGGTLTAEVLFGSASTTLPLFPAAKPGEYRASVIPTRPGTYRIRISGTAGGRMLETAATCGALTFSCVSDVANIEFPAQDPSNGQLAERLARGLPRAEDARSTASTARNLAIAALVLAALALAASIWLVLRGRR